MSYLLVLCSFICILESACSFPKDQGNFNWNYIKYIMLCVFNCVCVCIYIYMLECILKPNRSLVQHYASFNHWGLAEAESCCRKEVYEASSSLLAPVYHCLISRRKEILYSNYEQFSLTGSCSLSLKTSEITIAITKYVSINQ